MTTARSPLSVLKAQAGKMARMLKATERGESVTEDVGGKIAASLAAGTIRFAVMMDDKLLSIDMTLATVRATSEVALADYILKLMRGSREH